jgi:hypothetical protein
MSYTGTLTLTHTHTICKNTLPFEFLLVFPSTAGAATAAAALFPFVIQKKINNNTQHLATRHWVYIYILKSKN